MFAEQQPQDLLGRFIHVSSHLILPIVPGGSYCNYSLLTDLEAEAQQKPKTPPGRSTSGARSLLDFFGLQQSGPHPWARPLAWDTLATCPV